MYAIQTTNGKKITQTLGTKSHVRLSEDCYMRCHMDETCLSASYNHKERECWTSTSVPTASDLTDASDWIVLQKRVTGVTTVHVPITTSANLHVPITTSANVHVQRKYHLELLNNVSNVICLERLNNVSNVICLEISNNVSNVICLEILNNGSNVICLEILNNVSNVIC